MWTKLYICFNQNETKHISTLTDSSLKLVDKLTYLRSSVSSTENDINIWLVKAWSAIYWLSVIWKSNLSDKIQCNFFPTSGCVHTTTQIYNMDADYVHREKAWWQLLKNSTSYIKQTLEVTSPKTASVWPLTSHL